MNPMSDLSRFDPVWRAVEPYMRARKNDVHIPLSFDWCQRLLASNPEADADICSLAILLHDIGWYSIDQTDIIEQGFRSENFLQSDVRYLHESEGVRLGTEVLKQTGWPQTMIDAVCEIIDGHDTRTDPHHLNDRIVRDADKLWRYDVPGIAIASDWFGKTPRSYVEHLEQGISKLETDAGHKMAVETLAKSRAALKFHVL
jgi:HD superfamily phosphodiesterase